VFALPETFYGDHPPREPETVISTGGIAGEIADDKISSGSLQSGRGRLFNVPTRGGACGNPGGIPGPLSREKLPLLLSNPGYYSTGQKNQRRQMHTAAIPIRNPHLSHTGGALIKSYERELLSCSLVRNPFQVCVMISFRIPLLQLQCGKIYRKEHQ
jgi:hypothetical protein